MADLVRLEDEAGKIVGYVHFNETLASRRGITKLKNGSYALIYGDSENRYAVVVSDDEALDAIINAGMEKLLKTQKFKRLADLHKSMYSRNSAKITSVKRIKMAGSVHCVYVTKEEMDALGLDYGSSVLVTLSRVDD